jgi:hypothetical protein
MLKKNIFIVSLVLFTSAAFSASAQTATGTPMPGSDRDAHGCIPSAGYTWSAPKQACVRAWENGRPTTTPELRNEIKTVRQDTKTSVEALRKTEQDKIDALRASSTEENMRRVNLVRKEVSMILLRINAAVGRVQGLSERVSTRLDKLATQGIDVSASRKDLVDARAMLDQARIKIAAIKASADTTFVNPVPKGTKILKDLEVLVKDATKTMQSAQRLVAKSISDIKPGQNRDRPATTASTTTRN